MDQFYDWSLNKLMISVIIGLGNALLPDLHQPISYLTHCGLRD